MAHSNLEDMENVVKKLENKSLEELSNDEKWKLEHYRVHILHKGHDTMHAEMVLVLLGTLIVAQILLVQWKQRHYKSYQPATLFAMWVIPLVLSVKAEYWRFIFIWLLFSCTTGFIFRQSLQKPLSGSTPRLVYRWFNILHQLSYVLGIVAYIIFMASFFGVNLLFNVKPHHWMDWAALFLFYGLYYGVLGRDVAEICAERMASHIGYYNAKGMPTRSLDKSVCAVCGNQLQNPISDNGTLEKTYKLSCDHVFHEFCIRGWCIVGKKQTCPYCKEKVDLKKMFRNPWEKPHLLYGHLLDWIRWLVAWMPGVLLLVQGINWVLGLE